MSFVSVKKTHWWLTEAYVVLDEMTIVDDWC